MNRYVITDLHVDHGKLKEFCYRPEGYAEMIREAWMATVKQEDVIFLLGDLYFGKRQRFVEYMSGLPGTKILIRGNHDHEPDGWYMSKCGFAIVANQMTIMKKIILSHKPVNDEGQDVINIHGHLHDISPEDWLSKGKEDYSFLNEKHFNVCPEVAGYSPIEINRLLQTKKERD